MGHNTVAGCVVPAMWFYIMKNCLTKFNNPTSCGISVTLTHKFVSHVTITNGNKSKST